MGPNTKASCRQPRGARTHPPCFAAAFAFAGKELHYYKERNRQIRVNAAGALLHDWAKEQAAIHRLIEAGRVVPL